MSTFDDHTVGDLFRTSEDFRLGVAYAGFLIKQVANNKAAVKDIEPRPCCQRAARTALGGMGLALEDISEMRGGT